MTELGQKAVDAAKKNGMWGAPLRAALTDAEVAAFAEELVGSTPASENFRNMAPSVQPTYTKIYFSFKTEAARQRDLKKIVDRLNNNLKPM